MNVIFYIVIFIIGIMLGNIYKIFLKKNIIGLNILTGILYVLFTIAMRIKVDNIKIQNIIPLGFIMAYLIFLILLGSKEKEKRTIEKPILAYGVIISIIYIVYLCIIEQNNIYNRYPIYLVLIMIWLLIDNIYTKKKAENNYTINIIMMIIIMTIFTREYISILTIAVTLIITASYVIVNKIKNIKKNNDKKYDEKIRIGLILSTANIVIFLVSLIQVNLLGYIIK